MAEGPANLFIPVLSIPVEFRWILEFTLECSLEWSSPEWAGTAFRWNGLFVCYLFVMDNKQCLFGSVTSLLFSLPPPSRHMTTEDDCPHCERRRPPTTTTHKDAYEHKRPQTATTTKKQPMHNKRRPRPTSSTYTPPVANSRHRPPPSPTGHNHNHSHPQTTISHDACTTTNPTTTPTRTTTSAHNVTTHGDELDNRPQTTTTTNPLTRDHHQPRRRAPFTITHEPRRARTTTSHNGHRAS